MRKMLLFVLASVFLFPIFANGQVSSQKKHRNWGSYVSDRGFSAMETYGINDHEQSVLSLFFEPPQCAMSLPLVIVCGHEKKTEEVKYGRAFIRVDNREISEADVKFTLAKGCVVANVEKVYNGNLLNDAIRGNTVRFKLEIQGQDPVYKKYSLIGFTDAFKEALGTCAGIKERMTPRKDEDYFTPAVPEWKAPVKQKRDEEYF